jgi:glutamate synthase (NADPH/NADH) small chain
MAALQREFDAVVLSVGLGRTGEMGIAGEEKIIDGLEFIERSKGVDEMNAGRRVIVIGAGNTAVDCATIARRLGSEDVTMVYRRTEREMTCYAHEYEFARREGIEFRFLNQPVRVVMREGKMIGLECLRVELGAADASGRPTPVTVEGTEFVLAADQIVKAVGRQRPEAAGLTGLKRERGFIAVDEDFETSVAGVYAVGDCIRAAGAASTVMAAQDGKLAAAAIHARLAQAAMAGVR